VSTSQFIQMELCSYLEGAVVILQFRMQKNGVQIAEVRGFPPPLAERLRDELSVTTAEEFVDLAHRMATSMQSLLGLNESQFTKLRVLVEEAAPEEADSPTSSTSEYRFRTGLEPPPPGQETFEDVHPHDRHS
jgi:hypothetical protein